MSTTFSQSPNMVRQSGLVPVASASVRSTPLTVEGQTVDLGLILRVTTVGTGKLSSVMVETAVADADNADATQWTDCPNSEVIDFDLTALNVFRLRLADPILDKVRVRMTGNAGVAGAVVQAAWLATERIA